MTGVSGVGRSQPNQPSKPEQDVDLGEATRVWAKIGLMSFGGPAGQIALMHRIVVDEKRWISEERFLHALNFCMLLPGPEAQQLATYVGWLMHRIRGGLVAGALFVIPGFLVILALSYIYVIAGNLPVVQGLFTGLKAAVVVIVIQAVLKIGSRSLTSSPAIFLACVAFLSMYVWGVPFPIVVLLAAVFGAIAARTSGFSMRPHGGAGSKHGDQEKFSGENESFGIRYVSQIISIFGLIWLAPTLILAGISGPDDVFSNIGTFFSKMAVVTFGGAYAVLAYVSSEAVGTYHWLSPGEMIDVLAMAETTPGPLIMVTQYVGFLAAYRDPGSMSPGVAGFLGAGLTTWVTFVPCFLWIFVGAPFIERIRNNRALSGALAGVTAAVVGVIVNLAIWFAIHALFDAASIIEIAGGRLEIPVFESVKLLSVGIIVVAGAMAVFLKQSVLSILAVCGILGVIGSFTGF